MNMRVCLIGAMVLGLFCLAGTAQATMFFWDDFESQANYATSWVEEADKDPGTPPIGEGWTIMESPKILEFKFGAIRLPAAASKPPMATNSFIYGAMVAATHRPGVM